MAYVRQPQPRRRSSFSIAACGCLTLLISTLVVVFVSAFFLLPRLPNLAAEAVGFRPLGDAGQALPAVTPLPTLPLQNPAAPPTFRVDAGDFGAQTFNAQPGQFMVQTGSDPAGAPAAVVTLTEAGIMDLCRQRTDFCGTGDPRIRNASINLRPGGAVVSADVTLPELGGIRQRVSAVLRLDAGGQRFSLAGIDIGGTLYAAPSNELGATLAEVERTGNEILRQLALEAGGGRYQLSYISIDHGQLSVVLR